MEKAELLLDDDLVEQLADEIVSASSDVLVMVGAVQWGGGEKAEERLEDSSARLEEAAKALRAHMARLRVENSVRVRAVVADQ